MDATGVDAAGRLTEAWRSREAEAYHARALGPQGKSSMVTRYRVSELEVFVAALFSAAGLARPRARTMAQVLLQADLLGFSTHGLQRVPGNLRWLETGVIRREGEPRVLRNRGAVFAWDADYLPGPWVLTEAVATALQRVREAGVVTATLTRCTHVACLAAYLVPVIEAECIGIIMVSTPDERFVSPFGGRTPIFSNNPLAFCAPSAGLPLLFDISMAITAGGQVARAAREAHRLAEPGLKTAGGETSDDPGVLTGDPPGSIMPIGGLGHGHKGYALTVMTEVLSQVLAGHGRAGGAGAGEANGVFLQIIDPRAFCAWEDYLREMTALQDLTLAARPDDPGRPVRIPGHAAWQRRAAGYRDGVELYPGLFAALLPWAARFGVEAPPPQA
jgi:LDH2 family malate/lactate/ureidoglycolate dehydrogenase